MISSFFLLVVLAICAVLTVGFAPLDSGAISRAERIVSTRRLLSSKSVDDDPDIIARRIVVTGAVQGGYYRSCVLNEAGRFRRLVGTMTPPDDTDVAEIYVEGKRGMVEGFIRWCTKGDVGLSQVTSVKEVTDELPTGLYDGFYIKTR